MPFSKYGCMCPDAFLNSSGLILDRFRGNSKVACKVFKVLLKRLKEFAISTLSNLSIELSLDAGLKRRLTGADFSYKLLPARRSLAPALFLRGSAGSLLRAPR